MLQRLYRRALNRIAHEAGLIGARMQRAATKPLVTTAKGCFPAWLWEDVSQQSRIEPQLGLRAGRHFGYADAALPRVTPPGNLFMHLAAEILTQDAGQAAWLLAGKDISSKLVDRVVAHLHAGGHSFRVLVINTSPQSACAAEQSNRHSVSRISLHQDHIRLCGDQMQLVLARLIVQFAPPRVQIVGSGLAWDTFATYGKALASVSNLYAVISRDEGAAAGISRLREVEPHLQRLLLDTDH